MKLLEFDGRLVLKALYDAIDEKRQSRGMTWADVTREVNRFKTEGHPIASSTITGLKDKPVGEGDCIIGMLVWLGRSPESFLPGFPDADAERYRLQVGDEYGLRWDAKALHAALDARRRERGMTWRDVTEEVGGCASNTLQRLSKGGHIGYPGPVMRIVGWLDRPAADFVRAADGLVWADTGEFRRDPSLRPKQGVQPNPEIFLTR